MVWTFTVIVTGRQESRASARSSPLPSASFYGMRHEQVHRLKNPVLRIPLILSWTERAHTPVVAEATHSVRARHGEPQLIV